MVFELSKTHSIANDFLYELRSTDIQRDRMRFRKNVERLGEIMAYEVSKKLAYAASDVKTPLANMKVQKLEEQPVLVTVMRAGLPFFQGFLNFFDRADAGFIGAYRQESSDHITIKLEYLATTSFEGKTVILVDPMLATGKSIADTLAALLKKGKPAHLHIVSLIAAPEGISFVERTVTVPFTLWTCAIDQRLDRHSFIVPGLGDAGDLSYGAKI